MGNQVLYPYMENYAYGDRRTHMGITVCIRAGIAKIFAYGDPRSHNEIVRILGATYRPEILYIYQLIYPHSMQCHTSSTSSILTCCQVAYHVLLRMYRMMRHKMQRQQTPPRQKASEDIFAVLNTPIFFAKKRKLLRPWSLRSR